MDIVYFDNDKEDRISIKDTFKNKKKILNRKFSCVCVFEQKLFFSILVGPELLSG